MAGPDDIVRSQILSRVLTSMVGRLERLHRDSRSPTAITEEYFETFMADFHRHFLETTGDHRRDQETYELMAQVLVTYVGSPAIGWKTIALAYLCAGLMHQARRIDFAEAAIDLSHGNVPSDGRDYAVTSFAKHLALAMIGYPPAEQAVVQAIGQIPGPISPEDYTRAGIAQITYVVAGGVPT